MLASGHFTAILLVLVTLVFISAQELLKGRISIQFFVPLTDIPARQCVQGERGGTTVGLPFIKHLLCA